MTRLKENEAALRDRVFRLEQANRSQWPWVEAAPWIALGILGCVFAFVWFKLDKRRIENEASDIARKANEAPGLKLGQSAAALDQKITALGTVLTELERRIIRVGSDISDLWKVQIISPKPPEGQP